MLTQARCWSCVRVLQRLGPCTAGATTQAPTTTTAAQFSDFSSPAAIRDAVLTGSDKLGLDKLFLLLQIAPSMDEAKALKMYRGPVQGEWRRVRLLRVRALPSALSVCVPACIVERV